MAVELAVYETERKIIVHTSTCPSYSTVAREYQTSSIVRVPEGWRVVRCDRCKPNSHTVMAVRRRVHSISPPPVPSEEDKPESMRHPAYKTGYWKMPLTRNNPDSSFPPYGVTALDITHSNNQEQWWKQANCLSDDDRLGPWLEWLFKGDHTQHWTLTVQKVVCSECPVRAECLEQGVWGNETWGTWGGANVRERKLLRAKWIREGRIDERPNRPHNPIYGQHNIRREDGSRDTTTRGDNGLRVDEGTRADEDAGEGVPVVLSGREVRWPRTYDFTGSGWSSEGSGRG